MVIMMTVVNNLFQALTPKQVPAERQSSTQVSNSPMEKAALRGTYIKQLSEIRQLYDNGQEEYEEQRLHLVGLMRLINEQ